MPEITVKHEINTDEDTFWEKIVFEVAIALSKLFESDQNLFL